MSGTLLHDDIRWNMTRIDSYTHKHTSKYLSYTFVSLPLPPTNQDSSSLLNHTTPSPYTAHRHVRHAPRPQIPASRIPFHRVKYLQRPRRDSNPLAHSRFRPYLSRHPNLRHSSFIHRRQGMDIRRRRGMVREGNLSIPTVSTESGPKTIV